MEFEALEVLRAIHIIAAAIWFGAVVFATVILRRAVEDAGEAGRTFMGALQKGGRLPRYMGAAAGTTVLSGALLFWRYGYDEGPFASIRSTILTIAAIIGVAGWIFGLVGVMPLQRRMAALGKSIPAAGPTPETGAEMKRLQSSFAVRGKIVTFAIAVAFVLMVGRTIVF